MSPHHFWTCAFCEMMLADHGLHDIPVILLTPVSKKDCVLPQEELHAHDHMLKSGLSLKELPARIVARLNERDAGEGSEGT
jgi:hypothetical protein